MPKPYYITTPIYYINDKPHIGHTYATTIADVYARYHRANGEETFFLTGTDEHSLKNVEAARQAGFFDIQAYLDMQAKTWQETWRILHMSNSDFIRTTEERHKKGVVEFFNRVHSKGDIYKGLYQGYYCKGCEAFVRESDLFEGLCPLHKTAPDVIKEENYFFRASKYRDSLLSHIAQNPSFIQPVSRRNEIVNYIKDHFEDVSISRQNIDFGIPLPIDQTHVVYVWFDALINYLTGIGFGWDDALFQKYWPCDVHVVGKDIIKFHCALWPAMLLSADLSLPKTIFTHGFFTINGAKISKSLGNAIDPLQIATTYGHDALRYFLLREIPFGGDGDFSFERLAKRYESDLAKGLGNFVSRVLTLAKKLDPQLLAQIDICANEELRAVVQQTWNQYDAGFAAFELDRSLDALWRLISWGDKYIDEQKPWKFLKEGDEGDKERAVQSIGTLLEAVRNLAHLIEPILPETAVKIVIALGTELIIGDNRKACGSVSFESVSGCEPLFPPIGV